MKAYTALAKIILSSLGIYLLIRLIPQAIATPYMAIQNFQAFSRAGLDWYEFLIILLSPGLTAGWILLVVWLLFVKRGWLAGRIMRGIDLPAETSGAVDWIAFSYRLVCFIGGLVFLFHSTSRLVQSAVSLVYLAALQGTPGPGQTWADNLLGPAAVLAIGLYLLAGAPGFLPWQVRRTRAVVQRGGGAA